jgi:hypothetical protein
VRDKDKEFAAEGYDILKRMRSPDFSVGSGFTDYPQISYVGSVTADNAPANAATFNMAALTNTTSK